MQSREYDSISELAEAIGVGPSYLRRLMTLNFLAPDIVEALSRGDGPDGLTLDRLTSNLPHPWRDHRPRFGFMGPRATRSLSVLAGFRAKHMPASGQCQY